MYIHTSNHIYRPKMAMAMILCVIIIAIIILPPLTKGISEECRLDDGQGTLGVCKDVKDCQFVIDLLRAGVKPKICNHAKRIVCCPTELTLSAKKCEEYQEYLKIPLSFGITELLGSIPITCLVSRPAGFIVGGRDAEQFEYPHVVALGWGTDEDKLKYHCTGTLISEDYILTAAHCMTSHHGEPNFALVGDIVLSPENAGDYRQLVPIEKCIVHPNYKPPLTYHDIALVKLVKQLPLSKYLLPACLPQPGDKSDILEAVGFGLLGPGEPQTNTLQAVNLTSFTLKECQEFYDSASDRQSRIPEGLVKTQMCAGDKTDSGKDTCNGDSGGPVTITKEFRCVFHIVGITSFGARLCGFGQPGVFTRVLSYNNWIESIVWPLSSSAAN